MQFPFFSRKTHQLVYTLLISKRTVGACVWHVENGLIRVDGISDLMVWDEDTDDSLFNAADKAIGSLGEIEATQVLLSLPDDWVQGQSIHPKRKGLLRELTEKLELVSVGFVVTMEAVIASLKESSTTPLNMVCACVEPDAFIMAIITQSQSSPILRIGRSDRVTEDFLEGCSRLKMSGIPPQMCMISLSESENTLATMKQELENFSWDPSLFIQQPKITIESPAFVLTAVTQAGGREVIKVLPELLVGENAEPETVAAPEFTTVIEDTRQPVQNTLPVVLDAHTDEGEALQHRSSKLIGVALVLVALLICVGASYFVLLPKLIHVDVVLRRKHVALSGETTVVLSSTPTQSTSSANVLATLTPLNASGEIEVPTTGQKKTGDAATGSVTIFNLTSASKAFKSGTQLKTGKLLFETTEDVTIASASTGADYVKIPGKSNVKAKALASGEESNIAKNLELSVAGFDSSAFIARNENAFSGGTSRSVAAVAQKDLDTALTQLTAGLQQKITEDLNSKLESGLDGFVLGTPVIFGKKYDKSIGEEASSVSLTLNASASALIYNKLDVFDTASEALHTEIPAGSKLNANDVEVNRSDVQKISATSASMHVSIGGNIVLPIDTTQFASILAGKSKEDAESFLHSQHAVETFRLSVSPTALQSFVRALPSDAAKITLRIED